MAAAAARGSGRASAPRLLLLLLLALLLGPTGVGAVPDEDLSHRNKEPPASAQQLQPQPAAVQGPEAARAEKGFTPAAPVHSNKEDPATQTNLGFIHAFVAAISVIIVSELGDKTFFIAAIMAMRYNRLTVLAGAMLALGLMTCLSVLFGYATTVIPRVYTYYVSTALFAIFGIRMLREGLKMSPDEGQEELEEVQAELKKKDEEVSHGSIKYLDQKSTQLRINTMHRFFGGHPYPCEMCGPHKNSLLCLVCIRRAVIRLLGDYKFPQSRNCTLYFTFLATAFRIVREQ
uniref:transmembrane protein 165 isoform X2 n=1 Tax=Halichoerus grypus TaxID=9711 RepID=UPI001658ED1B|nr:transmembrane protein 165 isoform X2 [Halichoerus grypus]